MSLHAVLFMHCDHKEGLPPPCLKCIQLPSTDTWLDFQNGETAIPGWRHIDGQDLCPEHARHPLYRE